MKIKHIVGIAGMLLATSTASRADILTIAGWNFENVAVSSYVPNPTPSTALTTASASAIGMAGWLTPAAGTNDPDVLLGVSGDTGGNGITNYTHVWRVRAQKAGNGWSTNAPIGSQGAQFNVSTLGFGGPINVAFDWYPTTQGEGRMQLQYTTDNWAILKQYCDYYSHLGADLVAEFKQPAQHGSQHRYRILCQR